MKDPTAADPGDGSSYAPDLRRRAAELAELARSIERSIVMTLVERDASAHPPPVLGRRDRLCAAMLDRNLHQLHRAADDLRVTAMRFRERADELDAAFERAA